MIFQQYIHLVMGDYFDNFLRVNVIETLLVTLTRTLDLENNLDPVVLKKVALATHLILLLGGVAHSSVV